MIDHYPYLFLWKPVILSFIKVIDQMAHLKYLEYGKVPGVSMILRKVLNSDRQEDVFGELIKKCKRLTLFALLSNHSSFEMIIKTLEEESKGCKLFTVSLETNVNNFTIDLIKKWICEYCPNKDEYQLKIDMVLKGGISPMKITDRQIDFYFQSDPISREFLNDPLSILSFDHNSVVPYMKDIHYFIELTRNMVNFHENKIKSIKEIDTETA